MGVRLAAESLLRDRVDDVTLREIWKLTDAKITEQANVG
jgi:hypothetical protein